VYGAYHTDTTYPQDTTSDTAPLTKSVQCLGYHMTHTVADLFWH